ncbi:MRN complex-interacting protein [Anopheles stephensi]|uniref:MRN complex-interacting protein n=1 Tax=Anopheles stephensi TaxID=30069 RepID=UPI0016587208|nr:MRN complex-interacting protein [Anopheles stephensi]
MPQELRVVRCFQCLKYQVDIVKKANKWACKVCGVKQSLAREFFRGAGKDCRSVVHQLSMRNQAMDQQEEEVVKLVVQNKIRLPKPPVNVPTTTDGQRDGSEPIHGPSKWESFLTKEATNDDPNDCLSASDSFENVSSTTFDRERINCPEIGMKATGASGWNKYRTNGQDLHSDGAQLFANNDRESSSGRNWVAQAKSSIGQASKAKQTTISFQGRDNRWSCSARNDSLELPSFHHKPNNSRRALPNTTRKFVAEAIVVPSLSTSVAPGSSASSKPPEMPIKRKLTANPPLMNFGKRIATDSKPAPTNSKEPSNNVFDRKPRTDTETATVSSSKWAKYLQEDDETDENTDNNFIMF